MINKIKKEYRRFINKQFKKLFGNYEPVEDANIWSDIWKEYYLEHKDEISGKMQALCAGVDEKSINTAQEIWEKYVFLIPWQKYRKSFMYKKEDFFNTEEIKAQKQGFYVDRQKYKLPEGIYYESSVFKYGHGITCLPQKVLDSIKNKDFIDGGAFWGDSAIFFKDFTQGRIYSFEPSKQNFEGLKKTIALNNLENIIIPEKFGLSDKKEKLELFATDFCLSSLKDASENKASVCIETTTIDQFVQENNLQIGLIKLDVEGHELEAIKGALETIKAQKPALLISVYHHPKDFFDIKPLIESLGLNHKFMIRKFNDYSSVYETMLLAWFED